MKPGLYNLEQQLIHHERMWHEAIRTRDKAMKDILHHSRRMAEIRSEINESKKSRGTVKVPCDTTSAGIVARDNPTLWGVSEAARKGVSFRALRECISSYNPQKEAAKQGAKEDSRGEQNKEPLRKKYVTQIACPNCHYNLFYKREGDKRECLSCGEIYHG